MNTKILEDLGLTRNQVTVYISLLKLGSAKAQQIIKESGLHRSRVYDSLEKLQELGLASSVIKDYSRYFQAVEPSRLVSILEEKRQELQKIIPQLKSLEGSKKEEINASIYKGKEGLKTIHSEMLKEGKDVYVFGAKGLIFSELQYFMPNFEKERIKKRIKFICLCDSKKISDKLSKRRLFESKILPDGSDTKGVVNIFGNKTAIVLWKEKHPTAFMIENKDIADSFRKWFNVIYSNSELNPN